MSTSLADWQGAPAPTVQLLEGRFIRLENSTRRATPTVCGKPSKAPAPTQAVGLFAHIGPVQADCTAFDAWLNNHAQHNEPYFFSVIDRASGDVQGILSLMSIVPAHGRIEIGHVTFGAPMQRSPKSTEAVYLLAKHAFELGYRRLEWKCNNGNARSKYAAERLGFSFEGVFRQHMVVKGQNRDTAWYSILDSEWPRSGQGLSTGCRKPIRQVQAN